MFAARQRRHPFDHAVPHQKNRLGISLPKRFETFQQLDRRKLDIRRPQSPVDHRLDDRHPVKFSRGITVDCLPESGDIFCFEGQPGGELVSAVPFQQLTTGIDRVKQSEIPDASARTDRQLPFFRQDEAGFSVQGQHP